MTILNPAFSGSPVASVVVRTLGSLSAFAFVACSIASAQTLSPRPVARLISGSANEFRSGRRIVDAELKAVANVAASPSLNEATATERTAFDATNELRRKNGLAPLEWDSELCLIARAHSRNMSELGFFSHRTPDGLRLRDRARSAGIRYQVIGENIAYNHGYKDPGAFAVERWAISSGHRANLLSTEFRGSAIGSFVAPDGTVYLTQLFILR